MQDRWNGIVTADGRKCNPDTDCVPSCWVKMVPKYSVLGRCSSHRQQTKDRYVAWDRHCIMYIVGCSYRFNQKPVIQITIQNDYAFRWTKVYYAPVPFQNKLLLSIMFGETTQLWCIIEMIWIKWNVLLLLSFIIIHHGSRSALQLVVLSPSLPILRSVVHDEVLPDVVL